MKRAKKDGPFRKGKRWGIDVVDSNNQRHRPTFATREEAQQVYDGIVAQLARGEYLAGAAATPFSKALDLVAARDEREGLAAGSRDRARSVIRTHLRPRYGARPLSWFNETRMQDVKAWFAQVLRDKELAASSLAHVKSAMKIAFDEAIAESMMSPPNPMTEFGVKVPKLVAGETNERRALTPEEIVAIVGAAHRRQKGERELVRVSRLVMTMLGLTAGLRDQEVGAVCWDYVNLEEGRLHVRRSFRKFDEGGRTTFRLVDLTKTGKKGRVIHMSPPLHALLCEYRDRMVELGRPVTGRVPVLITERVDQIKPDNVMRYFEFICGKAKISYGRETADAITFYHLRHSAACLWRAVGMDLEHLKENMGHTDYRTTSQRYVHPTPEYDQIRREVEDVVQELDLERTAQGLIDGLGIALARRWREDGIDIPCSAPRSVHRRRDRQAALPPPAGANGPLIEGEGGPLIEGEAVAMITEAAPPVTSMEALRAYQRRKVHEYAAMGWTHARIAAELGIDRGAVSNMVRSPVEAAWMRKIKHADRKKLADEARRMRVEQDATPTEIAAVLGIHVGRVPRWLAGLPRSTRTAPKKIERHLPEIRRRLDEGQTTHRIADELGISRSGLQYLMQREGLVSFAGPRGKANRRRLEAAE